MGLFDGTALERPVLCDECGQDVKTCGCEPAPAEEPPEAEVAPDRQRLKVRCEKRKRGKTMTVVSGFSGSGRERQELLVELKNLCGAGGTLAASQVEIQGDHRDRITTHLASKGYRLAK